MQHGIKIVFVFLPADGEITWLLFSSFVFLLPGSPMQLENTYFCIIKVTGQFLESQIRISTNTDHSYNQLSSL